MDDKLEELRKIEAAVKAALAKINVSLEDFKLTLDEDQADSIKIRVFVNPKAIMTDDELHTDEEFNKLIEGL